jgi:hypothetical protein
MYISIPSSLRPAMALLVLVVPACSRGPEETAEDIGRSSAALTSVDIQREINSRCAATIAKPGACNSCVAAAVRALQSTGDITTTESGDLIALYSRGACQGDCGKDGTCVCGTTCPSAPLPAGTACCADTTIFCSYANTCGGNDQYHCKDGNWQINACGPCCL